jgi:D-glycerate 3-kinase
MNSIVRDQISKLRQVKKPLIVGIQGPQRSGKTTLVTELSKTMDSVVSLSLDDFYIPYKDQILLKNPLLEFRGLPGTHSVDLLEETLMKLKAGEPTLIPQFDKSLQNGRGDRLPIEQWKKVDCPDVILLEGWCLGFESIQEFSCDPKKYKFKCTENDLEQVNENLKRYHFIRDYLDYFVQIKAKDIDFVYDWRWQQELSMKQNLGSAVGLSHEQVVDFVSRFMPIYDLYLHQLEKGYLVLGCNLCIEIDSNRIPIL